jgi:hypothetical protein
VAAFSLHGGTTWLASSITIVPQSCATWSLVQLIAGAPERMPS